MPHVTFIHGIANKPGPEVLLRIWRDSLAQDEGLNLGAEGVTSSMVYWADVLYAEPEGETAEHESNDSIIKKEDSDIEMSWQVELSGVEENWSENLAAKLDFAAPPPERDDDYQPPEEKIESSFERIPLPWWLKRRLMKAFLRDVHHYLFNSENSPRPGATYRVQDEIRSRTIDTLKKGFQEPGPHVIVSHSMGTVIAYDCLKRVEGCPRIDALMTIGSPLGLDEIQDKLRPEWSREDGFPSACGAAKWVNVYDRFDPVAAFDPQLGNDFMQGGQRILKDINEQNYGRWRHNISKYLRGRELRADLSNLLGL